VPLGREEGGPFDGGETLECPPYVARKDLKGLGAAGPKREAVSGVERELYSVPFF
jgi:hypothetical protein